MSEKKRFEVEATYVHTIRWVIEADTEEQAMSIAQTNTRSHFDITAFVDQKDEDAIQHNGTNCNSSYEYKGVFVGRGKEPVKNLICKRCGKEDIPDAFEQHKNIGEVFCSQYCFEVYNGTPIPGHESTKILDVLNKTVERDEDFDW